MIAEGNIKAQKRMYATRGKYFYTMGDGKQARFWIRKGEFSIKMVLYDLTSYIPPARKFICKHFRVMS